MAQTVPQFPATFFGLTGMHMLHVTIGVIYLGVVALRREELDLLGGQNRVEIIGDSGDFRVIRQPTPAVEGGGFSYFAIQFIPTSAGVRTARVRIVSNDPSTSPFEFTIYGGAGSGIDPDVYEPDNTPAEAKVISTNGNWNYHTIHVSNDVDWSVFTLDKRSDVVVQTTTPFGDTRIYIYAANDLAHPIAFDNDNGEGLASLWHGELDGGTYFIRTDEYGNNATIPLYGISVNAVPSPGKVVLSNLPISRNNRDVQVLGTAGADVIAVDIFSGALRVSLNNTQQFFKLDDVSTITIKGFAGDDTIFIGADTPPSRVYAGNGDDSVTIESFRGATVFGGFGADLIFGGSGDDFINASNGRDTVFGNGGNDYITGNVGMDSLDGGVGNDTLLAGKGDDEVLGGDGNDLLAGGYGNDTLLGGLNADIFVYKADPPDRLLQLIRGLTAKYITP